MVVRTCNRASALLNTLRKEEFEALKKGRDFSSFKVGDSIEVERLPYMSANEPEVFKGVVIAKTNRASDTAIQVLNVEHGTPVLRRVVLYNPTVVGVKRLQEAFIHKGKKRVRRSKLYYLLKRDPSEYTVT
jgi:large subunit ribosomal protein L19